MSTRLADAAAGYCSFLRAELADLLADAVIPGTTTPVPAVFRPDLPRWFQERMPTACIVVRPAGGYTRFGATSLYLKDPRLDAVCYGANAQEAYQLAEQVAFASQRLMVQVFDDVLIHSANIAGGPIPLPDQQTQFPSSWLSVQVVTGALPQPSI